MKRMTPCELVNFTLSRLRNWREGDIRSLTLHIQPGKGSSQIQATWDDDVIECCSKALAQCHVSRKSAMVEAKRCIIDALQTIANTSGFGKIVISPQRKIESKSDAFYFEVICIVTSRIQLPPCS